MILFLVGANEGEGIVIIGSQFGDEGKGKLVDVLSEKVDFVVRYQGGNNAGHTVRSGTNYTSCTCCLAELFAESTR